MAKEQSKLKFDKAHKILKVYEKVDRVYSRLIWKKFCG
jgi:hypothetical protein